MYFLRLVAREGGKRRKQRETNHDKTPPSVTVVKMDKKDHVRRDAVGL